MFCGLVLQYYYSFAITKSRLKMDQTSLSLATIQQNNDTEILAPYLKKKPFPKFYQNLEK